MKLLPLLLPLALAGLLVGAAAPPVKSPPLIFEPKEKKSTVTVERGQELKVMLPTSDADHIWQIVADDLRYLKKTSAITAVPGDATAGASVTFLPVRNGHTRLSFVYVKRTDATESTPLDVRDIAVTITVK